MYKRFKKLCDDRGISIKQACKEIGISPSTVTNWKTRKSGPKGDTVQKIAHYFKISTDYFYKDDENLDAKAIITRIDHAIDMLNACGDDRDAEFFTKISKDRTFMKYIGILYSLKDEFKEQVYDYIEYTLNKEKDGGSNTSELYEEG